MFGRYRVSRWCVAVVSVCVLALPSEAAGALVRHAPPSSAQTADAVGPDPCVAAFFAGDEFGGCRRKFATTPLPKPPLPKPVPLEPTPVLMVRFAEGSALRVAALLDDSALWVPTAAAKSDATQGATPGGWRLWGADAGLFEVDGGVLRFALDAAGGRFVPDFERPADADGDGVYEVTVSGPVGMRRVGVIVEDRDEPGAVLLSGSAPQAGVPLAARLVDPDGGVGEVSWSWWRSAGRDAFTPIRGAEESVYVPRAADLGRRLRAVAVYADRHSGTAEATAGARADVGARSGTPMASAAAVTAGEVAGPLLAGLSASSSQARGELVPAFRPDVLHYKIACDTSDVVTVSAVLPDGARLAVNGIQPRPGSQTAAAVSVSDTSDVVLTLAGDDGVFTRYVVHCAPEWLAGLRTRVADPTAADVPLLSVAAGGWIAVIDSQGVPRFHREAAPSGGGAGFFLRSFGTGVQRRWAHAVDADEPGAAAWSVLDAALDPVAQVRAVAPLSVTGRHDLRLGSDGSVLLMAYEPAERDFSWLSAAPDTPRSDAPAGAGRPRAAVRFDDPDAQPWSAATGTRDSAIQMLGADGDAAWTWNSWGRVPLEDCAQHRFPDDYAHVNSVQMTPTGVLASFRGCSTVMLIDPDAAAGAEIVWRIGQTNLALHDWVKRGLGPVPLRLVGDPLGAFCGQHAASLIGGAPEPRLVMFDNGSACVIDPATQQPLTRLGEDYSRAVEYALDLANGEAVFVRDHSLGGLRSVLGSIGGHVEPLADRRWLIGWGRHPRNTQPDTLADTDTADTADSDTDTDTAGTDPLDAAVTIADPRTGAETFAVVGSSLGDIRELRPLPVSRSALDAPRAPLTAAFTDTEPITPTPTSNDSADADASADATRPPGPDPIGVAVAFSQPVAGFTTDTPSISITGGTLTAIAPRIEFGKPANSYILTITPDPRAPLAVRLVAHQPCNQDGICTASATTLTDTSDGQQWTPPATPLR